MLRCNDCRALILDHLYGLLDAPEAVAVDAHLASCPACAAVRAESAKMQGLLAVAAKGPFPQVRFEAPVPILHKAPAKTPVPDPRRAPGLTRPSELANKNENAGTSSRVGRWLPWAVAAAVLAAVPGTIIPVLGILNRAETAHKEADDSAARLAAAVSQIDDAKREANRKYTESASSLAAAIQGPELILAHWMADEKAVVRTEDARKVTWDLVKPAAVQPGAPNEFLVVVRDRNAMPHGHVVAEVRDQNDAVIHTQPIDYVHNPNHQTTVRLPANVWTKLSPQSELFLSVSSVDDRSGAKTELQEKVRLLGPVFATVLTTDKASYRPGETVFFRSLTLDRVTFAPPGRDQVFRYDLLSPTGQQVRAGIVGGTDLVIVNSGTSKVEPILGPDGKPIRGVGTGEFVLPTDIPDGDYTLMLRELPHPAGYPPTVPFPVTRPVRVKSGVAEMYRKEIGYKSHASYYPGETVQAWAELKFQDKPEPGAEVKAVVEADKKAIPVTVDQLSTGADGLTHLHFALPRELDRADVRLKVTFKTKHGEETVAGRVPVVGSGLVVEFFPEGGELVAGVPCRVYVRATTPSGYPVDITGVITDGRLVLANVETLTDKVERGANRGIGSFTFTPALDTPVWLKLKNPAQAFAPLLGPANGRLPLAATVIGVPAAISTRTGFVLPEAKDEGVVMTVIDPVTRPGEPIRVHLRSVGQNRNLVVGAYTRGRLSDTKSVTAEVGKVAEVQLMAGSDPRGGVVRVTVFEEPAEIEGQAKPDLKPVAERLVFRKPGEFLKLDYTASSPLVAGKVFAANSQVELDVTAADEKGNPAAAILYAAVVNTAVAPGEKDRLLTTHFLIAGEVNTPDAMEYADFLLTSHPKAAEALDLVLATQGWRRFAEQTPPGFAAQPVAANMECANLLVANGQYLAAAEPTSLRDHRKLYDVYWPRYEAAVKSLAAARVAAEVENADRSVDERVKQLVAGATSVRDEAEQVVERATTETTAVQRFRGAGWFAVAGFALLAFLLAGAAFTRSTGRLPLGIGTLGSLGLVAFLVFALGMADRLQAAPTSVAKSAIPGPGLPLAPEPRVSASVPKQESERRGGGAMVQGAKDSDGKGSTTMTAPAGGGFGGAGPGFAHPVIVVPKLPARGTDKMTGGGTAAVEQGAGGGVGFGNAVPGGPANRPYRDGWQPNNGFNRQVVRDEMLDRDTEIRSVRDRRQALDAMPAPSSTAPALPAAPGSSTGGGPRTTTTGPVGLGGALTEGAVKGAAKAEDAARRDDLEKAKKYAEDRVEALRSPMKRNLERSLAEEKVPAPPPGKPGAMSKAVAGSAPEVIAMYRIQTAVSTVTPLVVREYAAPRPGAGDRGETPVEADTILWQPVIVLPKDGKAKLNFQLGSAPGGYQVIIAGHTLPSRDGGDGRIGAVRGIIPVAPAAPTAPPAAKPPVPPGAP